MRHRRTSADVYRQIREEGLLSEMRFTVYDALFIHGPATAGEISKGLIQVGVPSGGGRAGPGNVSARLVELRDLGTAEELGEKECSVTGRNVILWDVTDQLPSGKVKKGLGRPPPHVMKEAVEDLRRVLKFYKAHGRVPPRSLTMLGKWMQEKYT
jgi:hypothetical protein